MAITPTDVEAEDPQGGWAVREPEHRVRQCLKHGAREVMPTSGWRSSQKVVSQGREMQGCERKTRLLTTEQTTWRSEVAVPSEGWEQRAECKELKGDGGEEVGKGAALYKLGRKWTKRQNGSWQEVQGQGRAYISKWDT